MFCSACGQPVDAAAQFCPVCGTRVTAAAGAVPPAMATPPPTSEAAPGSQLPYVRVTPPSRERPTAAGILAILGGFGILVGAGLELLVGSLIPAFSFGQVGFLLLVWGSVGLLMGILVVIFGTLILVSHRHTSFYGMSVIVCAGVSLVSFFGGFFVGFLLALVGGILALVGGLRDP